MTDVHTKLQLLSSKSRVFMLLRTQSTFYVHTFRHMHTFVCIVIIPIVKQRNVKLHRKELLFFTLVSFHFILLKICHCVAQVGLKPAIFLSGSPECW